MVNYYNYAKIKDNYCISYFGPCKEYLVQIDLLIKNIEIKYPEIKIYIGCVKEDLIYIKNQDRVLFDVDIKSRKMEFGHIYYVKYDTSDVHPILTFMEESNVPLRINVEKINHTKKCCILTKGTYPTKDFIGNLEIIKQNVLQSGYVVEVDNFSEDVGWLISVETPELFRMASMGIKTTLLPTGLGTELYKKMFPEGEIFNFVS